MTVWMDKTANGKDCLRTNSEEFGASHRQKSLQADWILIRATDGHVFTAEPESLPRLSSAQAGMTKYFLDEKGMAEPNVFAGQPAREAPKIDATDEKEVAT